MSVFKGNKTRCGICGCETDQWVKTARGGIRLYCPAMIKYPDIHELIGKKQDLVAESVLPKSVLEELGEEIIGMQMQLQNNIKRLSSQK